ncbi:peroxide stress protein YaaA [Streptococcus sp. DD13]|uniref:peroxide stress protein YaaA n=1 Tax=Streptococcus sp. DD13 TaxID=1777881 RepID=UPI00079A0B69|nr:peroxide stress protein YaaA [Streptococcus sp. DD13]KXT78544.1 UPF0246 protein YaaA [Streptococcus sp. DD13]
MKVLIPNAKELRTQQDVSPFPVLGEREQKVLGAIRTLEMSELADKYGMTVERVQLEWDRWMRIDERDAKGYPAIDLYDGLMYRHMLRSQLQDEERQYLEQHCLIATAFYGLVRPYQLISPHRLDFQVPLIVEGASLKQFWRESYDQTVSDENLLISFLSSEFEAVFSPDIQRRMVKVLFKEERDGKLKVHSTISKKGRGRYLAAMAQEKVHTIEALKKVSVDGFAFRESLSSEKELVFVRKIKE